MRLLRFVVAGLFGALFLAAQLLGVSTSARAQASTAAQVIPGYLTTIGCPSASLTPCFLQLSTVAGTSAGAALAVQGVTGGVPIPVTGTFSATFSTFAPTGQAALSAGTTTSNVALGSVGPTALVTNNGSTTAFINFGASNAVTATTSSYPVNAGQSIAFNVGSNTYIAGITASGTDALSITTGTGLPAVANAGSGGGSGGTVTQGTAAAASGAWPMYLVQGTTANSSTNPIFVQLTTGAATIGAVTQSGTWNLNNISGTISLPTGAATAANQINVQSAPGTSQTTALTIQGNASGIAVPVAAASLPLPSGAATAGNQTSVIGSASGGTAAASSLSIGGVYTSTLPALTTGQQAAVQAETDGSIRAAMIGGQLGSRTANSSLAYGILAEAFHSTTFLGTQNFIWNGTTSDVQFSSSGANGTTGAGVAAAGPMVYDSTNSVYRRALGDTNGNAYAALAAGSAAIGYVGSFNTTVSSTPTVQNAAYSSGNAIGGLQTISFFRTTTQPSGLLNNISVASKGGSTTALTLYIFNANPTSSTCTDKTAFSLAAADISKLVGASPVVLTPAVVGAGATITFASQQSPISVKNADGTASQNLYLCAVVGGTVTPASTSDLVFKLAGVQD